MRSLTVTLLLAGTAAACSTRSGADGPDYTSLSQLNAIWSLSGQVSFLCNGAPVNEDVSGGRVHVFDGIFDEQIPLPVSTCGATAIRFQGAIDLTGGITGNVSIPGSSALVDTIAGSCSSSSCMGNTTNTGLLSFTFTNTHENVYDGSTWQLAITCGDGSAMMLQGSGATIANGGTLQESGRACAGPICTAAGSTSGSGETFSLTGMVAADGALTASFAQSSADTLAFDGPTNSSYTSLAGTGTLGSTISLTQCSNTPGSSLPTCVACVMTN